MDSATLEEVTFHSSKVKGSGDVTRLEADLAAVDGVRDVEVNTNAHTATVRFDSTIVDRNGIQRAFEDAGYRVDVHADETPTPPGTASG